MFPATAEGQAALIASLSRRAYPTLELFVFSLVCGAIVGFGFLLDSQAVLLLGILVTPIMTPWVGFLLAIFTGSPRFLFETLRALTISAAIVFLGGLLTGFGARVFLPATFDNAFIHSRLWYHELFVLSIGAITLVASFARSEDKPFLPSILIAYAFYLPINASGFGLGSGVAGIWPQGLYVFIVHFALASLLGLITLFVLKLEPTKAGGIASGVTIVGLIVVLTFLMFPQVSSSIFYAPTETLTPTPTMIFTATPSSTATLPPTLPPTWTNTPQPSNTPTLAAETINATDSVTPTESTALNAATPSATSTTSMTVPPSATATLASTPQPIIGKINAGESGGANLRQTPNGKYITTLLNDAEVEVSLEKRTVNGVEWLRVFATVKGERVEGWLLASVVEYDSGVTPAP
jgi:hypothetical protein